MNKKIATTRPEGGLVSMRDAPNQRTVGVWNTGTMLDKACDSAGALSAHQHEGVPGVQDVPYSYIGRIDSLMGSIVFNF